MTTNNDVFGQLPKKEDIPQETFDKLLETYTADDRQLVPNPINEQVQAKRDLEQARRGVNR